MGASSAVAAGLVVAIVGVGVWNAQDSPVKVRTVPSTTPGAHEIECETGVETVPANEVPSDVAAWAGGEPVVGHGELWTARKLLSLAPTEDNGIWRAKIAWFTRPFGIPRIDGRRLDGPGTFHASADRADDQRGTWVASGLEFSQPGCWEVTASFDNSEIVFRILVGDPPRPLAIGTIAGTLREVGGPPPGLNVTIPGTISVAGDATAAATRTSTGSFSVDVPAGTYTVTGTSPMINDGRQQCVTERPVGRVVVVPDRTILVTVVLHRLMDRVAASTGLWGVGTAWNGRARSRFEVRRDGRLRRARYEDQKPVFLTSADGRAWSKTPAPRVRTAFTGCGRQPLSRWE